MKMLVISTLQQMLKMANVSTLHLQKKVSQFVTHTCGMVKHILKVVNILTQHQTRLGVTLLFI